MYEMRVKACMLLMCLLVLVPKTYAQQEAPQVNSFSSKSLMVRTNIPTWFLGVPSVGLSYKITDRLELASDIAFSRWNFKRKGRSNHWNNLNISPQLRTYVNQDKSTYLGVAFNAGQSNMSREQADYMGGSIAIGKQYYAGKKLLIDIGLNLGYLRLKNREKFTEENGYMYRVAQKIDHSYWGPTALSIRLSRKVN